MDLRPWTGVFFALLLAAAGHGQDLRPAQPAAPVRLPRAVIDAEEISAALTLAELERMALTSNPTLAQAGARVEATRGNWLQVGLKPNPQIGYSGQEIGNEGRAGQQGIQFSQEFVTKGKLDLNRMAAEQEVMRAEQLFVAQQQRVLTDVRRRFYEALVAQRRVDAANGLLDVAQKGVTTAESLLNAREVARIDLLQARVIANTARIRVAQAEARLQETRRRLEAAIGSPLSHSDKLYGDLTADLPVLNWDDSLGQLLQQSPELSAAYADIERARWQLEREAVEKYPNVTVQGFVAYDDATQDTFASVGVMLPIPYHDANQGAVARASAELAAAETNVRRLQLSLQNRLAQAFRNYDAARREFELYDRSILPDTRQSLEIVRGGYPAEFDYLKLITAQREYFQAELGRLEALEVLRSEAIFIEGMLLDDSLEAMP